MKTISLDDLHARAKDRPPGYVEDVLSFASAVTDTHYTISDDAWKSLRAKYGAPVTRTQSPRPWPLAARVLRGLRRPGEKGVGDTLARIIGNMGGDAFKRWSKRLGFNCHCDDRQAALNSRWSYDETPDTGLPLEMPMPPA